MSEQWESPESGEDSDQIEYKLVLPFIIEGLEFTLGFEAGLQYGRMQEGRESYDQTVHIENQRQISIAAKAAGWSVRFEPLDATFCVMHAMKRAP